MQLTTFFVRRPPYLTPVRQTIFLVKCIEDSFWESQPPLTFWPCCRALVERSEDQEIATNLIPLHWCRKAYPKHGFAPVDERDVAIGIQRLCFPLERVIPSLSLGSRGARTGIQRHGVLCHPH